MARQPRMRRVDEAIRVVLGDAIAKYVHDPRVGFVTVTGVQTSSDLRHARVFVSVLGDLPARVQTLAGLRSAHGVLQSRLAAELHFKHTPTLEFEYDESVERGMRISRLIDSVGSAGMQGGDADGSGVGGGSVGMRGGSGVGRGSAGERGGFGVGEASVGVHGGDGDG